MEDKERTPSHKKRKRKDSRNTSDCKRIKNKVDKDDNSKSSTTAETDYTQHVAPGEHNEFDKGQPTTSKRDQTTHGSWKKGRRIVSLDRLAKCLEKCNDCCEPLQLHNCINETRHGLRSELSVKCLNKNCLATNLISTDVLSDDQKLATMVSDALQKSGIQRDQFNTLLECLDIPHLLPGNGDRVSTQNTQRTECDRPRTQNTQKTSMPFTQDQGVQTEDVNFEDDAFEGEFEPLQQPPILKQLKNILEQYPDGAQIIRELVQNAEDAEASQVKLLYHADATFSPETGKYRDIFRGPALCFYNDAIFKLDDWKGIKSVYTSVKETDSLKIGRFGLGFKSVFHITDTPVIISGDRLLIINPLERRTERVCHTIKFDWLFKEMKFRGVQEALNNVLDINGDGTFGLNLKDTRHYPGTIFWFPLRTQRSELSETVYKERDMKNLFSSFQQEAALTLLFLKSVNSIEIYDKPSKGKLDETFTVNVSNVENQENIENKRKYIMKCLKSSTNGQLPQKSIVSYYMVSLVTKDRKEGTKKVINWAILNYLQGTTDITCKRLMDLAEDKELGYYPYVSVAYPLSPLITDKETGHVFCFLPLPLENNDKTLTGLPVHVNGYFALTSNRRHMKWPSKDQTEEKDKSLVWNKLMVTEVLPKAYLHLIQEIHKLERGNSDLTYKCIPDYEKVDDKWKIALKPLYKLIFSEQLFYSIVDGGKWIKYKDAIFFVCRPREENAEVKRDLVWTINEYKENLVEIPPHIQRIIQHKEEDLGQGPASLVTPKFIKRLLNKDGLYKEFTSDQKMNLLRYIVKDECVTDFINVQLIPVDQPDVFKILKQENDEDFVYLCDKEESEILPGIKDKLLTKSRLPGHVKDVLLKCAAGEESTTLRELSKEDFPKLLKASLENIPSDEKFQLVDHIWTYINNHFESLEVFENLPVIPHKVTGECIQLCGNYILDNFSGSHLPKAVRKILSELSVIVLRDLNENIRKEKVLGHYIQTPTFQGVVCVLEKMIGSNSELQQTELVLKFNRTDRHRRIQFAGYLGQENIASVDVKTFLKKLELFPLTDGRGTSEEVEMTSIKSCQKVAPERNFFIKFPEQMIDPSFKKALDLAKHLGCTEVNENDLILRILEEINGGNMYSSSEVQEFMKHFLKADVFSASEEMLQIARKVHFIPREDDSLGMASELFLRTKDLEDLFTNESNKFMKHDTYWAKQETSCLIKVGLKTEDNLTEDDLLQTCKSLHDMDKRRVDQQSIEKKMRVFIKFLSKHEYSNELKEQMRNLNWLPIRKEMSNGFPCHLPWKGNDPSYFLLTNPTEGTHNKFSNLSGSTKHILDMNDSEFNMLNLSQEPEPDTVLKQLQTIVSNTKGRLNMSKVLSATEEIYDYFSDLYKDNMHGDQAFKELQNMKCVWTEEEFTSPAMVYFKTRNEVSLNPYMFKLPSGFEKKWDFFQKLGCNTELEIKDYFVVQDRISEKHTKPDSEATKSLHITNEESIQDLEILVGILSVLSEMDLPKEILDDVLVPVESEYDTDIVLMKVHECTYRSGESIFENIESIEDEDDVSIRINTVHSRVGNELAEKLGVPSLTSRVLSDSDTSDLICEWGQHEPLTVRLKNLLHQYEDGSAVTKELIQNADDSGASVVKFLIDDRTNEKFKKSLIDDKMSDCQGPALWVYNDGMFEEKDFENILKLGGRTKETDTSKIGKFGLGFSSVYNITDVPSFISGNSIVFLDPRTIHLGKVLKDKSRPGIRMKISKKNAWMLKKIPDQFMPYNGVFGCDLSASGSNPGISGTLFRFPLRTEKQAEGLTPPDDISSDGGNSTDHFTDDRIKRKPYRKEDLVNLFEEFTKGAGNLLIYSQNIKCIEWYHLPKHASPGNEKCIYRVSKKSSVVKSTVCQSDLHQINILKHVANLVRTSPLPTETLKITSELLIKVDVPDTITTLIEHATPKAMTVEEKYYVSWASGNEDSLSKSQELSQKGALPLGSVAVPESFMLTDNTDNKTVPYGFYGRSHLFCFLPLPRETPLPVHVNGCFSVEESRKDIFHPGDSKCSEDNVWNKCLLEDAICMSYLELLENIPTALPSTENGMSYSYLWPRCKNDETFGKFTMCFYRMVVESCHRIFRRETHKAEFSTCWFLESKLLHDKYVGNTAFKCLENFQDDESMVVMDIEKEIHDLFLDAGCKEQLENQIFSIERFFKEIFFKNIGSPFWTKHLTPESRNGLVLFALNSRDQGILYHLKSCECIPTLPKGKLVRPSELVNPNKYTPIFKLFNEEDERFPDCSNDEAFREEKHLKLLQDLGMMHDKIPISLIKDRALSVTKLNDNDSIERCKALMLYLSNNIGEMELDIHNALKNIKFLPVMQKPNDWPMHWVGDNAMCTTEEEDLASRKYEEPCTLFKPFNKNLVGGVLPLLDDIVLHGIKNENYVLDCLGLKSVPTTREVLEHLHCVSEVQVADLTNQKILNLKNICDSIYFFLNEHYKKHPATEDERIEMAQKKIILFHDVVVEPRKCFFEIGTDCRPDLYEIHVDSEIYKYNHFLKRVGVRNTCPPEMILDILRSKSEELQEMTLCRTDITFITNLLNLLSKKHPETDENMFQSVYVPDMNGVLRHKDELCEEDENELIGMEDDIHIVHDDLTKASIKLLGIKSKSAHYISRYSYGMSFGQSEKLTTRLKGILKDYPNDVSILNELLQNADDAGATKIHFIHDMRNHPKECFFDKSMNEIQGPALCVYNDSCFSENDLQGISKLGEGSKGDDPTKTGQFGIGFNAVYHLTDVPSFLSIGPKTPDNGVLVMFDPNKRYVPLAKGNAPGMRVPYTANIKKKYPHIHNIYLQDVCPSEIGTWFRFPLRDKNMCETSEISEDEFDVSKMKELFEGLKKSMFESLLFLTNVKEITLWEIPAESDTLTHIYSVSSTLYEHGDQLNQFISKAKDNAKRLRKGECLLNDCRQQSVVYTMSLTDRADNEQREETWVIAQTFGCIRHDRIPDKVVKSLKDGNIGLSPRGGTAVRINPPISSNESFNASCFLPLPVRTGLPVHVNGHFSLNSSRQNIWQDDEKKGEKSLKGIWNTFMLEEIIPSSYIVLIQELIEILYANEISSYLERFNRTFPDMSKNTGGIWEKLVKGFYNFAITQQSEIFPIVSINDTIPEIKWVSLLRDGDDFPAYFNNIMMDLKSHTFFATEDHLKTLQTKSRDIADTLKDLGMKLLDSPIWIFESLSKSCDYLEKKEAQSVLPCIVTAADIFAFIRSWNKKSPDKCRIDLTNIKVSDSCLSDVSRLRKLLDFCFQYEMNLDMLNGLPLLVTNDDVLKVFTKSRQIIVSEYCDLLPKTADCFLHRELVPLFKCCVNKCPELFMTLTIDIFAQHIEDNIETKYKTGKDIPWNPKQNKYPNKKWMKTFWEFLVTQRDWVPSCKRLLSEWCLVPGEKNHETTLFPFSTSYAVLDIDTFYSTYVIDEVRTHFMKLLLPKPWESCGKHSERLFASDRDPDLILRCLSFHSQSISLMTTIDVTGVTGEIILNFLSNNLKIIQQKIGNTDELQKLLRSLPLYMSFEGHLRDMDGPFKMISLDKDQGIPHNALLDIRNICGLRLFQKKDHIKELFTLLGVIEKNDVEFYCDYILPNASIIVADEDLMAHLNFIRENILKRDLKDWQSLQPLLKAIRFIPDGNSEKATACSFFSPHMEIHRHMCRKEELPPAPFDSHKWKYFMEIAGMNTVLTKERFKKYANDIDRMGKSKAENSNLKVKSELLMKELMKITDWHSNISFLQNIKEINFIVPHVVQGDLREIDRQYNADSLISFQNSTYNEHSDFVWTKSTILPEYANIRKLMMTDKAGYFEGKIEEVEKNLCIHREPLHMEVISHVHTICDKLEKKFFDAFQKDKSKLPDTELIERTMELFYDYFYKKMHIISSLKAALDETPLIYCIEKQLFFKARQMALKIKDSQEILPYLCCGSEKFGKFFPLFRHLGASDYGTITQYASILRRLKNNVQLKKLTPDELGVVKRSLTAMAGLTETGDVDIPSIVPLYLPTDDDQLLESTEILFCDNESYRQRLNCEQHVIFMKTVPDQGEIQTFLRKLPHSIRPQLLSSVVQEDITVKQICPNSQHVNNLQCIISAPLFLKVLSNMMSPKLSEDDILSAVSSIHIQSVTELESVLQYKGTTINSSRKTRWCVWKKNGSIYELYIHIQCKPWKCNHLLVRLIGVCTGNHLENTQIDQLRTIFQAESPASLPDIIQSLDIHMDQSENTWIPILGSHVPLYFHHLLDNNFTEFTKGEIVVYDVYDPEIDEEEEVQGLLDAEYIYVKIMRKLEEDSDKDPSLQRFEIYDGHTEMTVFSLRLFKLNRKEEEASMALAVYTDCHEGSNIANKDKIFDEIRKTLEKVWELGDKRDIRRIVKRLLLRWHPDKNIERSEFCTEVTQFIFDVIRRLETGRSTSRSTQSSRQHYRSYSTSRSTQSSHQHYRSYSQDWWYGDQTNEGRIWERFYDNVHQCSKRRRKQYSSRIYSDICYIYVPNPQPTVARRWLKQAKMDICSASEELQTQSMNEENNDIEMYNWICYKCHQAAEKALKALIYNKDANGLSRHSHNLRFLMTVNDKDLQMWTNELSNLLPYNSMRYPDSVTGCKIPADVFTKEEAEEARKLADCIVQFAERNL